MSSCRAHLSLQDYSKMRFPRKGSVADVEAMENMSEAPPNVLAQIVAASGMRKPASRAWRDAYVAVHVDPPLYAQWLVNCSSGGPQAAFLRAVRHNKLNAVDALLNYCPALTVTAELGYEALMISVKQANAAMVRLLLAHGATPASHQDEPLKVAAKHGLFEIVTALLDNYVSVTALDKWPLALACYKGHLQIVREMLDRGIDVHTGDESALRWAAQAGQTEVVRVLLDHGADVHHGEEEPLRMAAVDGHLEVVRLLLSRGADAHAARDRPIREALCAQQYEIAKLLVMFNTENAQQQDSRGWLRGRKVAPRVLIRAAHKINKAATSMVNSLSVWAQQVMAK